MSEPAANGVKNGRKGKTLAQWLQRLARADLAHRCSDGVHVKAANSTYVIPLDQPGAAADAIRRVVEAVRDQTPLRPESP